MKTFDTWSNHFRKITGRACLNYNENPQVAFFNVFPSKGAQFAAKKLRAAGFEAHTSIDDVVIVDLFNNIGAKPKN